MSQGELKLAVVGGLGLMASPMAKHWKRGGPARVLRVHDRGNPGPKRDQYRQNWKEHGASLVSTFEELVGDGDLDGVFVCCGKNADDLPVIADLAERLSPYSKGQKFICHMSTVSVDFVDAAHKFCQKRNVRYANYPLTGSASGAEKATMLILASGEPQLYDDLLPALSLLGTPKFFGQDLAGGAEVKFIGHLMVFNGLMGICSAAAVHAECFNQGKLGGHEQTSFFDFLNTGAGGTRQWDVILRNGINDGVWDAPFFIKYGVVDAIYVAQLCIDKGVSNLVINNVINVALAFSFIVNQVGEGLATHAIVRELIAVNAEAFDRFLEEHSAPRGNPKLGIEKCIASLPESIRQKVALELSLEDFERTLRQKQTI